MGISNGRLNSENPRLSWEKAFFDEEKRTEVPEAFRKPNKDQMVTNQLGLVQTALKNYQRSQARLSATNMVGV